MRITSIEDRFWKKVEKSSDDACWLWKGATTSGYGVIYDKKASGGHQYAHRFSYQNAYGDIPNNMLVCHKCDNTLCVRPDHLFIGTYQDNTTDMISKGRQRFDSYLKPGELHPHHKLSTSDVQEIHRLYTTGSHTYRSIAAMFEIHYSLVCLIIKGKRWK